MKRLLASIVVLLIILNSIPFTRVYGEVEKKSTTSEEGSQGIGMDITAPSAVLMEGATGKVIFSKNKDKRLIPASITKIMTLLLIFEGLESGKITLKDSVTVSEHAASMGGSQVFLEPYETQDVHTMIKCISIASANDASVAMAEHIAGSEEAFVGLMNKRAKELGMKNTHFKNCCGLDDTIKEGHYTSAYDVALMSRELTVKYPQIHQYSTVWMDSFVHTTKKGESEFGLSNTNKLVRTYKGITGLKTGSTQKAKFCLSATANREGMDLITVVMACPSPKDRFVEAAKLLDYGFANCTLYIDDNKKLKIPALPVAKGVKDHISGKVKGIFKYTCFSGVKLEDIKKEVLYQEDLYAPINKGAVIGEVRYTLKKKVIGKLPIVALETIPKAKYKDYLFKIWKKFFLT